MSSTYNTHAASLCIDGSWDSYCHAIPDTSSPWLSLQLSTTSSVGYVVLYNRRDCCQDRLSPLQVWVGSSLGDYDPSTAASCGVDEVTLTTEPDELGPFAFRCADGSGNPLVGDYVTLVLPGASRTLNVAEVEAYEQHEAS